VYSMRVYIHLGGIAYSFHTWLVPLFKGRGRLNLGDDAPFRQVLSVIGFSLRVDSGG
jgi:hypothetical protein